MQDGTLGQRIRTARKNARFSMSELGRRVAEAINRPEGPYSAQAVQQWEVGTKKKGETIPTEPDVDTLRAITVVTSCNLTWLISGIQVEAQQNGGSEAIPTKGRVVAIITPGQALQRPIDYTSDDQMHTQVSCSRRSFGFNVFDRRNAPEFQLGDRVVIDPAKKPEPGFMVFAQVDGEPIFARYTQPRKRGKHWTCALEALDRTWGSTPASSKSGDRIIGVMVDHSKPGSEPRYHS